MVGFDTQKTPKGILWCPRQCPDPKKGEDDVSVRSLPQETFGREGGVGLPRYTGPGPPSVTPPSEAARHEAPCPDIDTDLSSLPEATVE